MRIGTKIVKKGKHYLHPFLLPFIKDNVYDKYIFVSGCHNSGTTLLANLLALHPNIEKTTPKVHHLPDGLPTAKEYGYARMFCKCFDKVSLNPDLYTEADISKIKKIWQLWAPAPKQKSSYLLVDGPVNLPRLDFLKQWFKPAYFIFIVRNGYAVSEGIYRKSRTANNPAHYIFKDGYPIEWCAEQWKACDQIMYSSLKKIKNYHIIYYENLVAKPDNVLNHLANLLELNNFSESTQDRVFNVHEKKSTIRDYNLDSIGRLSDHQYKVISEIAREALIKHNYYK